MRLQAGMLPEVGNTDSSYSSGEQVLPLLPLVLVKETLPLGLCSHNCLRDLNVGHFIMRMLRKNEVD